MSYSGELAPFYFGYAHEALARTAKLVGDTKLMLTHKAAARKLANDIKEMDERDLLLNDIEAI